MFVAGVDINLDPEMSSGSNGGQAHAAPADDSDLLTIAQFCSSKAMNRNGQRLYECGTCGSQARRQLINLIGIHHHPISKTAVASSAVKAHEGIPAQIAPTCLTWGATTAHSRRANCNDRAVGETSTKFVTKGDPA
jgi:hypothetical protein